MADFKDGTVVVDEKDSRFSGVLYQVGGALCVLVPAGANGWIIGIPMVGFPRQDLRVAEPAEKDPILAILRERPKDLMLTSSQRAYQRLVGPLDST